MHPTARTGVCRVAFRKIRQTADLGGRQGVTCLPCKLLPGMHQRHRARGGAADSQAQACGRRCPLRLLLGRRLLVGADQMRVHCRHAHEHCGSPTGEARPHPGGLEPHKLYGGAVVVRTEERVHQAVDVVKGQGVEDTVAALPPPCLRQRLHLRPQAPAASSSTVLMLKCTVQAQRASVWQLRPSDQVVESRRGITNLGDYDREVLGSVTHFKVCVQCLHALVFAGDVAGHLLLVLLSKVIKAHLWVCRTPLGFPVVPLVYSIREPAS